MEVSRDIARFARSRPVIECAQCGEANLTIPGIGLSVWLGAGFGPCGDATACWYDPFPKRSGAVLRWHNAHFLASPKHLSKFYARKGATST